MRPGAFVAAAVILGLALPPARADDRAQKYYYEDISYPFFAKDPAKPGWMTAVRPAAKPGSFPIKKPKDGLRVFVIGGSIAGLLQTAEPENDFQAALKAALPGRTVEVVNCGMAGYETFREAMVEQEILEYSPDLIIFLTGHNEGIASAPIPVWIMKAQERLSKLAAFRALVKTLHPEADNDAKRGDEAADARDATFARNLAANVEHAREKNVRVALVVPPRNYREPAEVSAEPYDPALLPGWLRFLKGDYAGARERWRAYALQTGGRAPRTEDRAMAWGLIGRAEEKLGLQKEAMASYDEVSKADRAAICGANCQRIIRKTAAEKGALLVEADRMFRSLEAPRAPGMDVFNDRMHWKPRFNCLVSSEIIASLRADPELAKLPWDATKIEKLRAGCALPSLHDEDPDLERTVSYVLMGLSWNNFKKLSTVSVAYLDWIRRNRPAWLDDVPSLLRRAVNPQTQVYGLKMAGDAVVLPRLYWHAAEARLLNKDLAGGQEYLEKAVELEPKRLPWARLSLGVVDGLRGKKAAALESLRQAVLLSAGDEHHAEIVDSAALAAKELQLPGIEVLYRSDAEYWIKEAQRSLDGGDLKAVLAAADQASALTPSDEQERHIAQLKRLAGMKKGTRSRAEEIGPQGAPPEALKSRAEAALAEAEAAFVKGDNDAALAALEQARAMTLQPQQLRRVGQYYRMLHKPLKFLEVSDELSRDYPEDADLWLMRCEALLLAGRKAPAEDALARAEKLAAQPSQRKQAEEMRRWLKRGVPESAQAEGGPDGGR